jgi:hypothetical protein
VSGADGKEFPYTLKVDGKSILSETAGDGYSLRERTSLSADKQTLYQETKTVFKTGDSSTTSSVCTK